MGFAVNLARPPQRIVSLVPSQTELLYDLGLEERIVGVTKFCVHPERAKKTKAIVGGTKKFDIDAILRLNPDLVIGNKEENYEEGITTLRASVPVWMSDITTVDGALAMILSVGEVTQSHLEAIRLVEEIQLAWQSMKSLPAKSTLYLMWYDPWMGAASQTFIDAVMTKSGLTNVLHDAARYPVLTEEVLRDTAPEIVLLSSEPFPFSEKHIHEIRKLLPAASILGVDGEFFSWYGSRLRWAPRYIDSLREQLT